jgi:hypothetical protein
MAAVSALARGPWAIYNELMKVIVRWPEVHKEGDLLAHSERASTLPGGTVWMHSVTQPVAQNAMTISVGNKFDGNRHDLAFDGGGEAREPSVRVADPLHWCCASA